MTRHDRESWDAPEVVERFDGDWPRLPVAPSLSALADLVELHHGTGPILEVGCGTGRTYEALMRRLVLRPHGYVGVDVSPAMLERARARYPDADLREGDLSDLPFGDGSFGSVVCIDVLQHLPEIGAPIAELLRIARGHVFLLLWLRKANGTLEGARSDEEVIAACRRARGKVLDFLVIDGPGHDEGIVRLGVSR